MKQEAVRTYVETSVFGGIYDTEFKVASLAFFNQARAGLFSIVVSETTEVEIARAPAAVRNYFNSMAEKVEIAPLSGEAIRLQQAYLKAGIVSEKWAIDCLHVAIATVNGCGLIVSWNFKHIVNFRKVPLYNAVNTINGFKTISIASPLEVVG